MGKKGEDKLKKKVEKLGLQQIRRHIFICADTQECECASGEQMRRSWKYLKKRLKELGLANRGGIGRSRTQCLDVCTNGPVAVVYPEGVWYGHCDETVLEEIIQRHLVKGEPAEEFVIARSPGLRGLE